MINEKTTLSLSNRAFALYEIDSQALLFLQSIDGRTSPIKQKKVFLIRKLLWYTGLSNGAWEVSALYCLKRISLVVLTQSTNSVNSLSWSSFINDTEKNLLLLRPVVCGQNSASDLSLLLTISSSPAVLRVYRRRIRGVPRLRTMDGPAIAPYSSYGSSGRAGVISTAAGSLLASSSGPST